MTKLKMTHNEYMEFVKRNISKVSNEQEPNYGYKQYLEDVNSVEVLPYDLSNFGLPENIERAINCIFTEEITGEDDEYTLKGFAESEKDWYKITDRLNLKRAMGYYYSGYCYSETHNMYMTYSEGDLYLKLFTNEHDYKSSLERTIKWYEEN